jgi:hypothetical protein
MRNQMRNSMRKNIVVFVVVLTLVLCCGARLAQAQDDSKPAGADKAKNNPITPYRLDFSFDELQDGKKINTRHYTSELTAGQDNDIRIGLRVPIVSNDDKGVKQFQYLDVGTTIRCESRERLDDTELTVHAEVSDFDKPQPGAETAPYLAPVIRQIKLEGRVLLIPGKPILVGSVDDPNSKRQFQLEVTATKMR